jgi:hypothetical protein
MENSQLARHNRKFHEEELAAEPEPAVNTHHMPPKEISSFSSFGRKASQSTGNGQRYLIAKALGQDFSMSNLDDDDIDMMMSVSRFVTTLTWTQQDLLREVLSKTTQKQQDDNTRWKC